MISLLHATRGRLQQAIACREKWLAAANDPESIEHLFAFDADDEESAPLAEYPHVVASGEGGCVEAWNLAAVKCAGQILVQLSDDWTPPKNWDETVRDRLGDLDQSKVLAVSDGFRSDKLLTIAILTRARYEAQGWMFYPGYFSMMSDWDFTHSAYRDGVIVEARDVIFSHDHPNVNAAEWDETYARQNDIRHYRRGYALFLERNPEAMKEWPWHKRLRFAIARWRGRVPKE